jgi:hypothetical protein
VSDQPSLCAATVGEVSAGERQPWRVELVILASAEEVQAVAARIGEVVCLPPDHPGACETPWTLTTVAVADLDEPERSEALAALGEG